MIKLEGNHRQDPLFTHSAGRGGPAGASFNVAGGGEEGDLTGERVATGGPWRSGVEELMFFFFVFPFTFSSPSSSTLSTSRLILTDK